MEEKCEIELTEGYHSINSRDVRLHIHKGISKFAVPPSPKPTASVEPYQRSFIRVKTLHPYRDFSIHLRMPIYTGMPLKF